MLGEKFAGYYGYDANGERVYKLTGISNLGQVNSGSTQAQATVVNAATGNIVVNQQFTSSMQSQISNAGVYVLHIETASGALVGQFVVQ